MNVYIFYMLLFLFSVALNVKAARFILCERFVYPRRRFYSDYYDYNSMHYYI